MIAEPPLPVPPTEPLTFRVRYESSRAHNRDLQGEGTLTIRGNEFVFSGRARGTPVGSPAVELMIRADQITNVGFGPTGVEFKTPVGKSGEKDVPFIFFCDSPAEAERIARLMPTTIDPASLEAHAFGTKLRQLAQTEARGVSVTVILIALNVVAFVIMGFLGAGWFDTASMRPYLLYVGNQGAATTAGEWWRLVTAMFVHYGILHLAFNMWALYQSGELVERLLGRWLFLATYLGAGLVGSWTTLFWHGDKVCSAGASGAVFGVYGALFGYLRRQKQSIPRAVLQPLLKSTLTFAAYNLVIGALHPQIDNAAHIGGLVGGVVFGWLCALPLDAAVRNRETPRRLALVVAVVVVICGIGYVTSPRFDYRVRDELAWSDALDGKFEAETKLLNRERSLLVAATNAKGRADLADWVRREALPYYEDLRTAVARLQPAPRTATAKRQERVLRSIDVKLSACRALLAGLEAGDPAAVRQYQDAEAEPGAGKAP